MKKYLNIKSLCVVTSIAAAITALMVGNLSAFLGWFSAFIYAFIDLYRKDCL